MKHNFINTLALITTLTLLVSSCIKNESPYYVVYDYVQQKTIDSTSIVQYITENNIDALMDSNGLFYQIINQGDTSANPTILSTISIKYKGYLLDGSVFDETNETVATFALSNLIQGWQFGIPLIGKGGSIKLMIPSEFGYGRYQVGSIPANSVLIFDIELVDFKN